MSIAILNSSGQHNCCIGFLIDIFKDYTIDIFTQHDNDKHCEYYKSLYPESKVHLKSLNLFKNENYNLSVNINSHDKWFRKPGIISIAHVIEHTDSFNKFICLTPWIKEENIKYIFPLYRGIINKNYKNKILLFGSFGPDCVDDDLRNFINALDEYEFWFIGGEKHIFEFDSYFNVKQLHKKINMIDLVTHIKESKFILTKKIPYQLIDRYSGALGHSMSHCKPMIIQNYISTSYDLPGIIFEKKYSETIDIIKNMTDEGYNQLLNLIDEKNKEISHKNGELLNQI